MEAMTMKPINRSRIVVSGRVQGVGFRPFVYRLATELKLTGNVQNTTSEVIIEIEGSLDLIETFLQRLRSDLPPLANTQRLEQQQIPVRHANTFEILPSELSPSQPAILSTGQTSETLNPTAQVLPDLSTCSNCLQDILSSQNRRYGYPFTNCTHCGPRFSIITGLPYDRDRTTMAKFTMCPACNEEYDSPQQRRFHAQPTDCSQCGPALSFWRGGDYHPGYPLEEAVAVLNQGKILALKGLGDFQLLVNARDSNAVDTLRQRKGRPDKLLALMCPNLEVTRHYCKTSEAAAALLDSPQGPIFLLPKRSSSGRALPSRMSSEQQLEQQLLAENIAPNCLSLGVMLPTTPLHHLLLRQYGSPIIATSGNLSEEPICTDEQEALWRLIAIADAFLVHNRPIQRPVDDSVVQLVGAKPQVLQHARGYAPQFLRVPDHLLERSKNHSKHNLLKHRIFTKRPCVLALGAQLKSAIAVSTGDKIMLSQHTSDLNTPRAITQLKKTVRDFLSLYRLEPDAIACDQHPDYASTQLAQTLAKEKNIPLIPVQHHYAHILSCMAEHQLKGATLGIAWDGTGYGSDKTLWGGEFLQTTDSSFERVAHFLPYFLPGGACCTQEPRRSAIGLLYSCYGESAFEMTDLAPLEAFKAPQLVILRKMLTNKINTPVTSSVGRLFDGIASLLNLHQIISYEGQAAMTLEAVAYQSPVKRTYPFKLSDSKPSLVDWRPMIKAIVSDICSGVMTPVMAAKFHNTLTEIIVEVAKRSGLSQVVLAGECFQNARLSEQSIRRLNAEGLRPYWPQQVPPNDGGLAVGHVMAAWEELAHVPNPATFAPATSVPAISAPDISAQCLANAENPLSCV